MIGRPLLYRPFEPQFEHLILTRFNIPVGLRTMGLDPEWLRDRFALFEKWCLPSVGAQTNKSFRWLVFFHAATPEPWRSHAHALAKGCFEPIWLAEEFTSAAAAAHAGTDAEWLVTTRLDNDDGLAPWFIEAVQPGFREL